MWQGAWRAQTLSRKVGWLSLGKGMIRVMLLGCHVPPQLLFNFFIHNTTSSLPLHPALADGYTCAQQAKWGKCGEAWVTQGGFCRKSCGRC